MEYCSCGSIKSWGKCTNRNCPAKGSKRKGWLVKGIFLDFGSPVTYQEAYKSAERIISLQAEIQKELRKGG